jgi:hypothetical protein
MPEDTKAVDKGAAEAKEPKSTSRLTPIIKDLVKLRDAVGEDPKRSGALHSRLSAVIEELTSVEDLA